MTQAATLAQLASSGALSADTSGNLTVGGTINAPSTFNFKNRLINGGMWFDQRNNGTAVTASTTSAYVLDRWSFVASTTVSGTLQYGRGSYANWGAGTNAFYFSRSSGTYAGTLKTIQPLESNNCLDLAGQSVTLSFYTIAGSTWSGGVITAAVITSTGTDQTAAQFFAGTATGQATAGSTSVTPPTSGYQRFSVTVSIPSNATQVAVFFQNNGWTGTGTGNDFVYITGVQLEKGSVATSFDVRPYGTELALCQRYYEVFYSDASGQGVFSAAYSTQLRAAWQFKVEKRAAATFALLSTGAWGNATPTSINIGISSTGFYHASSPYYLGSNGGTANVGMAGASAEL